MSAISLARSRRCALARRWLADLLRARTRRDRPHVARRRRRARAGPARRRRSAGRRRAAPSTRSSSRRCARAISCTTATPRLVVGADADLALLAGDYLYALGPRAPGGARRPRGGARALRPDQPLRAQLHDGDDGGAWPSRGGRSMAGRASSRSPAGPSDAHERAKAALRAATPTAAAALLGPPRSGRGRRAGVRRTLLERTADSIGLRSHLPDLADGADKKQRRPRPEPDPPGYFEGESMTRRHGFSLGVQARASRSRGRAARRRLRPRRRVRRARTSPGRASARSTTSPPTPTAARDHDRRGDRRGRQDDRLRPPGNPDLERGAPSRRIIAISTRCAHLGCPVRYVQAAGNFICPCHGGVYDFQGKVIGGPPVRPLDRFQTRVTGGRSRSARATASPPARARPRPRPRRVHRRGLGVHLPAASLPSRRRHEVCPSRGSCPARSSAPRQPGEQTQRRQRRHGAGTPARHAQGGRPGDLVGWVDERTGGSGFLTGMLYRKVPKGTNWFYTLGSATLFAFVDPGAHRGLPGDVLHALGDRGLLLGHRT